MNGRPSNTADRWWMLLPVALFAFALMPALTAMSAQSGDFPAFIPMPGVTPRGVAVDKIGNVFVSVGRIEADNQEHILLWEFSPDGVGPTFLADIGRDLLARILRQAGVDRDAWEKA